MKLLFVLLIVAAACLARCSAVDANVTPVDDTEENIKISALCAANIIVAGGAIGGIAAYTLTPAALCTAGFCPAGVTAGSFASWWQSTMPLVAKGSLFSQLTSLAMGGAGTQFVVTGGVLGGATGALYLKSFCAFVDDTDPNSYTGKVFGGTLAAVKASIQIKEAAQSRCASSEQCTAVKNVASGAGQAAVDSVSSLWNWGTSYASKKLKIIGLELDINDLEKRKKLRIYAFGEEVFDYLRASNNWWIFYHTGLGVMYKDCLGNVLALESELHDEQHNDVSQEYKIKRIENGIDENKGEFGLGVLEYLNSWNGIAFVDLPQLFWSDSDSFTAMFFQARADVEKTEKMILEKRHEIATLSS